MIYIETGKRVSPSFSEELGAAGLPSAYSITTRRIADGAVEKGHPRAIAVDVDESRRADVQAVLDAHAPFFGHVEAKKKEAEEERDRRVAAMTGEKSEIKAMRQMLKMVAKGAHINLKGRRGQATQAEEDFVDNQLLPFLMASEAHDTALDNIKTQLDGMTDAEAGAFDVTDDALWP